MSQQGNLEVFLGRIANLVTNLARSLRGRQVNQIGQHGLRNLPVGSWSPETLCYTVLKNNKGKQEPLKGVPLLDSTLHMDSWIPNVSVGLASALGLIPVSVKVAWSTCGPGVPSREAATIHGPA